MRFDVSLDRNEFVAGDHLDREIVKRVRGARVLIVVATPEAVKSRWVKREIETFAREGKRVVPIVFGNIPGGSTGLQLASHVYIRESRDNLMKGPATEVVQTIARTFHAFRRRTIRTALVLLMLVVLVIQIAVVLATVFRQFEAKSQLHDTKQGTGKTDNQGPQSKERQGIP
jgi:hypothetical protein